MKHAILITAYTSFEHLIHIIDTFDNNYTFYIHIDKKSSIAPSMMNKITSNPKVTFVSQEYIVNWGGKNHLNAILLLVKEALKNSNIDYIHLISGQDFPIKSPSEISAYLQQNKGTQYIDSFLLPTKEWSNGGMPRIEYYNFYDVFNAKSYLGSKIIKRALKLQKFFKVRRTYDKNFPPLHGGSTWWTLSYDCLEYIIDYTVEHPLFLKRFEHTFCSEEIYFQTIIASSPFADKVSNNNLRYIDWTPRDGISPVTLDESDYDTLLQSEAFFARKFQVPKSKKLLTMLSS